jgi:hypothetical protein
VREDLQKLENLLEFRREGLLVVKVGLMTTMYFRGAHTPEMKAAVLRCLDFYFQLCRGYLKWAKHPSTYRFHTIESGRVPEPSKWLAQLKEGASWEFAFRGGDKPEEANAYSIEVLGCADRGLDELSFIKASVPMTFYTEHGGTFSDLVLSFAKELRPFHGYGGLGILESPDRAIASRAEPAVFDIATRFPGLNADYPTSHSLYLKDCVKGADWIVVLSDHFVEKLGGVEALRGQLSSADFVFMEYPGGLLIKAGSRPQMGDREKNQMPELYVQLARVLKPIRVTKHRMFHHKGTDRFDQAESEAWLARFDSV